MDSDRTAAVPPPAPLGVVLLLTLILSIGTGGVTHGLYFIAESACGFGRSSRFLLGVIIGIAYIPAALSTGPILRRLEQRGTGRLTPRALFQGLIAIGGLAAAAPPLLAWSGIPHCWSIWLVGAGYGASTGLMWPVVEWYLSGGRKHASLLRATGRFNIVWSTAVVAAFLLLAPFVARAPLEFLLVLAGLHGASLLISFLLPPTPARHVEGSHPPHPPVYVSLLAAARRMLPASYLIASVLAPYFPGAMDRLGVRPVMQPLLVSVWFGARVLAMTVFDRWHGWHGRASMLVAAGVAVVTGFVACMAAPSIGSVAVMALGLAVFGLGMGAVYTAALYYVLEVGSHGADAGGSHEALIGIGYTVGPAIGLAASLAVANGALDQGWFDLATALGAVLVTGVGIALAYRR